MNVLLLQGVPEVSPQISQLFPLSQKKILLMTMSGPKASQRIGVVIGSDIARKSQEVLAEKWSGGALSI
jgi:hypothetical protein